jgi:hypothetical protein
VNDNVLTGTNSVYGFKHSGVTLAPIGAFPTQGTSVLHLAALKDQLLYTGIGVTCLYISEPLPSSSSSLYPNGDIAMFTVNTVTGVPTYVTSYAAPAGVSSYWGIGLTTGVKSPSHFLYAGYSNTGSNTIISWKMNAQNCALSAPLQHPVTPLNGGVISGMAEAIGGNYLVVTYNDGSIQSFSTPASGAINPSCPSAIDSTGFLTQGSMPSGVDVTSDGRYAIFGDISGPYPYGPTELETIKLPIVCGATTKDFGGTAVARSWARPSCKKKMRWPNPHSGAVRKNSEVAPPWIIPSARPLVVGPMSWMAKSE